MVDIELPPDSQNGIVVRRDLEQHLADEFRAAGDRAIAAAYGIPPDSAPASNSAGAALTYAGLVAAARRAGLLAPSPTPSPRYPKDPPPYEEPEPTPKPTGPDEPAIAKAEANGERIFRRPVRSARIHTMNTINWNGNPADVRFKEGTYERIMYRPASIPGLPPGSG